MTEQPARPQPAPRPGQRTEAAQGKPSQPGRANDAEAREARFAVPGRDRSVIGGGEPPQRPDTAARRGEHQVGQPQRERLGRGLVGGRGARDQGVASVPGPVHEAWRKIHGERPDQQPNDHGPLERGLPAPQHQRDHRRPRDQHKRERRVVQVRRSDQQARRGGRERAARGPAERAPRRRPARREQVSPSEHFQEQPCGQWHRVVRRQQQVGLAAEEVIREHREQHRYDPRNCGAHAERAQHEVAARARQREREQEKQVDDKRRIGREQCEATDQQQAEVVGTLRVVEQPLAERRAQRRVRQVPTVVDDALDEHQVELGVVDWGVAQRNGQIAVPQAQRPRRAGDRQHRDQRALAGQRERGPAGAGDRARCRRGRGFRDRADATNGRLVRGDPGQGVPQATRIGAVASSDIPASKSSLARKPSTRSA